MTGGDAGGHPSPRLLIATTNRNKLNEIRALLANAPVDMLALDAFPPIQEPEETGSTFEENARLKARYYAAATGLPTVAEDSGLEVDALDRGPGVHSARFLGPSATYPERFDEIFRRLDINPALPRSARFVCAVAIVRDGAVVFETRGTIEGAIAPTPAGEGGFGYDPIFYYPPFGRTLAEVSRQDKLRVAHRGHAFRALAAWIQEAGSAGFSGPD